MTLKAIQSSRKTGNEPFQLADKNLSINLLAFWQWSSSDLLSNALRGILAEFIVASDLGCTDNIRQQWDAYDIKTLEGIKVEVKSSAYLQSWDQDKFSDIKFDIGVKETQKVRQADVYVFCVLAHKDKTSVNPLDMSQWKFYVLSTQTLNEKVPTQKKIALSSLLKLKPVEARYGEIKMVIAQLCRMG